MAKGKHAAALFEVIHADRRFGKKTSPADSLSTPKWWFKGKGKVRLSGDGASTISSAAPAEAAVPEPINYMPSIPGDSTARRVDMKVDPDRQEIAFKLTYTSAIVGAFALIVVLSLAYVIGRRMSQGPTGAMAATISTNELRKGPAQPGVMDLAKAARDGAPTSIAPDDESANLIDPALHTTKPQVTGTPTAKPTTPVEPAFNGKRIINKNYMIMQSFPESEKPMADEAVKRLSEAGIGATIEHGLKGWPPSWYCVVGTMPFERTGNNPVYDAYYKSVMDVSAKYAGKTLFKKFDPTMKKWTEN